MTDQEPATSQIQDPFPRQARERFQAGDLDALGELYNVFTGPVHAVVRGVLGPNGAIDDVVQETFMRAWRGASSFDPDRAIGPWLFTIARRTSIDMLRKENRPTRSDHEELTDNVSVDLPGIEDAWERWEIRIALDRLPEEERTVLMLSHYHGLTHPQIAEHLAIPPGTVKSRSHRGHQRLSGMLGHLVSTSIEGGRP